MVTKLKFHTPTADSTNKSSTKHTCALFIIVLEKDDTDPSHQRLYFSAKLMTEKNCLLIRITRLHKGAFSAILRDIKCTVRKGVQSGNESDLPRFVMNLFCVLHKRVFAQNYILQSMFFFFFCPRPCPVSASPFYPQNSGSSYSHSSIWKMRTAQIVHYLARAVMWLSKSCQTISIKGVTTDCKISTPNAYPTKLPENKTGMCNFVTQMQEQFTEAGKITLKTKRRMFPLNLFKRTAH